MADDDLKFDPSIGLSATVRVRLGLSVTQWARALAVSRTTVERWEGGTTEPTGLHESVIRAIGCALEEGVDPRRTASFIALGIGSVIMNGLRRE